MVFRVASVRSVVPKYDHSILIQASGAEGNTPTLACPSFGLTLRTCLERHLLPALRQRYLCVALFRFLLRVKWDRVYQPSVFDAPGASSFLAAIAVALIERDFRSVARSTNAACTQLLLPGVVIARRSSGYGFMIFIGSMKLIPYFENDTYGMALFFSQLLKRLRYSGSAQGPFQETLRRFGCSSLLPPVVQFCATTELE